MPKDSQNICNELKSTMVCCEYCILCQKWERSIAIFDSLLVRQFWANVNVHGPMPSGNFLRRQRCVGNVLNQIFYNDKDFAKCGSISRFSNHKIPPLNCGNKFSPLVLPYYVPASKSMYKAFPHIVSKRAGSSLFWYFWCSISATSSLNCSFQRHNDGTQGYVFHYCAWP